MFQFLSDATHEMLMQSGNRAYSELFLRKMSLEAELKGVKSSYDLLLKSIPTSAGTNPDGGLGLLTTVSSSSPRVAYLEEDYDIIRFWTEKDWNEYKRSRKNDTAGIHQQSTKGRTKSKDHDASRDALAYIEDENGVPISGKRAADLCALARSVFEYLATLGMAPKSWGKASAPAVKYFLDIIYQNHDELRLCDGNWKANRLATDIYPGWARGRKDLGGASDVVKNEPTDAVKIEPGEVMADKRVEGTSKRKDPPTLLTGPTKKKKEEVAADSERIISSASAIPPHSTVPTNTLASSPLPQPEQPVIDPLSSNSPSSTTTGASTPFTHAEPSSSGISPASSAPFDALPTSSHVQGPGGNIPTVLDKPPAGTSVAPSAVSNLEEAQVMGESESVPENLFVTETTLHLVDPFNPAPASDRPQSRIFALNGHSETKPSSNNHSPDDAPSLNSAQKAGTVSMPSHLVSSTVTTSLSSTATPPPLPISSSSTPTLVASSELSKSGQSTAAAALFKPSKTSCSELNLFGTEYCNTHVRATKPEVKAAFDALSEAERLHWRKLRTEMLAAKKCT
ncbi:hypothetical protein FPV67DRAFT_1668767 [Lyophyllum atratum]|nr:hypothetical protein FPV67DRAFT_1668767 [Lyophyllum atratum]